MYSAGWELLHCILTFTTTVVNGGLPHCCFNGPTSCNVAGIYWLSDVYCYSFTLGIVAVSCSLDPGRAAPFGGGTTFGFRARGSQPFGLGAPGCASSVRVEPIVSEVPHK